MSGYDWIGQPKPVETSAPLFAEGSRKRYDPRAGTKAGTGGPPLPGPPVVVFVGNADGDPASAECGNGLLLFERDLTVSGHATPHAVVRVWMLLEVLVKELVGSTQADASGAWSVDVHLREDGRRCFAADQTIPGSTSSPIGAPVCVMIGSCIPESPLPEITGGTSSETCNGLPIYYNVLTLQGTGSPTAEVRLYLNNGPNRGSQVGRTVVDAAGLWSATLNTSLPEARHCVIAVQQVPGSTVSRPSPEHCFYIGTCPAPVVPPQITDLEAAALRYSPVEDWRHGALSYEIDGEWVYGVLKRVVEV